ncbi:hypothetical protein CDD82_4753 [Ophiocordyceps australis]|uniref:FHA domain-containing protein n=1 Tax=Ophiocordyceps australis TaxID=1399860 RepID=A0A2C5YZ31_9HYPO|nr:hypothetical protein CDD82_4753 [Ophiocordyceps australis]
MTAVASPPAFPQISRAAWGIGSDNQFTSPETTRGMFGTRKPLSRTNSSSSVSSNSSNSTVTSNGSHINGTAASASELGQWVGNNLSRKRPQPKNSSSPWTPSKAEAQSDFTRIPTGRVNGLGTSPHLAAMQSASGPPQMAPQQQQQQQQYPQQQPFMRPMPSEQFPPSQPMLCLLSLNGTFERKTIAVPFSPDTLRIGRQTNQKTVPTTVNGFFDSKVLSRQHAEIFAERNGKVYIRDIKSSNGTFVNGTRLSQENRESEPHELQTSDQLELGIDIVSEDQKTVIHHKVAARVEHAGFASNTNNVLDMSFGDLDPANGSMLVPNGSLQMRGRTGSNASTINGGRMTSSTGATGGVGLAGASQQRPFFVSPVATDQIIKRLANEIRNARLQAQDLNRTHKFVKSLLSKEDIKDLERPEPRPEPARPPVHPVTNGSSMRADARTRFSDPPAPPPQQPLPEKPDAPSLRRGTSDRSRPSGIPPRQENLSQIIQLTEALNNARRDIDSQTTRMQELEIMLQKEREAREAAEGAVRKLEAFEDVTRNFEAAASVVHAKDVGQPGSSEEDVSLDIQSTARSEARDALTDVQRVSTMTPTDAARETAAALQSRVENMETQMMDLGQQVETWKRRCETAESERDGSRQTLAEMVLKLRVEESKRATAEAKHRSRSRHARSRQRADGADDATCSTSHADGPTATPSSKQLPVDGPLQDDPGDDDEATWQAKPCPSADDSRSTQGHFQATLPYASMIGVVLVGMGLMAYLNSWQPSPRLGR